MSYTNVKIYVYNTRHLYIERERKRNSRNNTLLANNFSGLFNQVNKFLAKS